jgi:hypothetical protein
MKIRTLLLGSAAAFAAAGAAQAADLSVAEPVDYVRVCDAFGAGYWYIPGTDTCLKIGGYVQFDVNFHTSKSTLGGSSTTTIGLDDDPIDFEHPGGVSAATGLLPANNHSATYDMGTEASVQVTAKSMTEYGPLTGYVEIRAKSNNSSNGWSATTIPNVTGIDQNVVITTGQYDTDRNAYIDTAWLELGMLLAGRAASIYDYSGGFTIDGSDYDSDAKADQVRLSWAMSGFGVQLAIEDPRDRWGTSLSTSYSMPNIVGALTMAQGHWDGKLSFGFAETTSGSGFGVQAGTTIKLDSIAPGDRLLLKAAWAQNEASSFAASNSGSGPGPAIGVRTGGSIWSAMASFQHFWTPTLSSAVTFDYANQGAGTLPSGSAGTSFNVYQIYGNLVWAPVTGFLAGVEGGYTKASNVSSGVWTAKIRFKRSW